MSENEEKLKKPRRKRREFTPEFKMGAVKRVLEQRGRGVPARVAVKPRARTLKWEPHGYLSAGPSRQDPTRTPRWG
jgi:hypothetical protein